MLSAWGDRFSKSLLLCPQGVSVEQQNLWGYCGPRVAFIPARSEEGGREEMVTSEVGDEA